MDRADIVAFGFKGDEASPTEVLVELAPHATSRSEKRMSASRAP